MFSLHELVLTGRILATHCPDDIKYKGQLTYETQITSMKARPHNRAVLPSACLRTAVYVAWLIFAATAGAQTLGDCTVRTISGPPDTSAGDGGAAPAALR